MKPFHFSAFLYFVKKEFYHIFRDRWTLCILIILPILMIILFGFGITAEIKNAKIAVFDPSRDAATQKIVEKLAVSEYFTIYGYTASVDDFDELFKKSKITLAVVFSENFYENMLHTGDAQIQLIADATDPNTANTLVNYASGIIASYRQDLMNQKGISIPYQIVPEVKLLYNPDMNGAYNTVPGVLGMILMLICAMMTSVSIAREKELGTMEVLLASPIKPFYIILSKVMPFLVISLVNFVTILLLSVFVLKVPVVGSLALLCCISLIFIFVSLALGLFISSLTDKQMVAMLISAAGLMLPIVLLSGLMFPIENMPIVLQWIAQIIPAKWYIVAVKNIMIKGAGIASVIPEISVLSLMAFVLIFVSLKKFKIRLE